MPQAVERDFGLKLLDEMGLFGTAPHDRELAAQDVPELRNLVEVCTPEQPTEGCDTRVIDRGAVPRAVTARRHRAELHHAERIATATGTRLREEQRSPVAEEVP